MKKLKRILPFCLVLAAVLFGAQAVTPSSIWAMPIGPRAEIVKIEIFQERDGQECFSPGCLDSSIPIDLRLEIIVHDSQLISGNPEGAKVTVNVNDVFKCGTPQGGTDSSGGFSCSLGILEPGQQELKITANPRNSARITTFTTYFRVHESCIDAACLTESTNLVDITFDLCRQVSHNEKAYYSCMECLSQYGSEDGEEGGIWTALGCIPTNYENMVEVIIRIGLLVGGGIATLIILAGSFMLSISQGDPQKTTEAKEMITSAIIGLIFIIFSISLLQLIGVQILQIPGFGQ